MSQTIIFFFCKNLVVILVEFYRITSLCIEARKDYAAIEYGKKLAEKESRHRRRRRSTAGSRRHRGRRKRKKDESGGIYYSSEDNPDYSTAHKDYTSANQLLSLPLDLKDFDLSLLTDDKIENLLAALNLTTDEEANLKQADLSTKKKESNETQSLGNPVSQTALSIDDDPGKSEKFLIRLSRDKESLSDANTPKSLSTADSSNDQRRGSSEPLIKPKGPNSVSTRSLDPLHSFPKVLTRDSKDQKTSTRDSNNADRQPLNRADPKMQSRSPSVYKDRDNLQSSPKISSESLSKSISHSGLRSASPNQYDKPPRLWLRDDAKSGYSDPDDSRLGKRFNALTSKPLRREGLSPNILRRLELESSPRSFNNSRSIPWNRNDLPLRLKNRDDILQTSQDHRDISFQGARQPQAEHRYPQSMRKKPQAAQSNSVYYYDGDFYYDASYDGDEDFYETADALPQYYRLNAPQSYGLNPKEANIRGSSSSIQKYQSPKQYNKFKKPFQNVKTWWAPDDAGGPPVKVVRKMQYIPTDEYEVLGGQPGKVVSKTQYMSADEYEDRKRRVREINAKRNALPRLAL